MIEASLKHTSLDKCWVL